MNLTEHTEFRLSGKGLRDYIRTHLLVCGLAVILQPHQGLAQQNSDTAKTSVQYTPIPRDGQHDFDFEIGTWRTHLKRLLHPLTGSTTWVEYDGATVVRAVWNGRANLLELEADGPGGHYRRSEPASIQSGIPSVESQFFKQQRRYSEPTHDWRLQRWPRRVFRPGNI